MNAFKSALVAVAMFMFAGSVAAEQVTVKGDELKNLIVTEKGSTWTTSNGSRVTFFPNGRLIHCAGDKPGYERCDDGTYVLTNNSTERKYNTWYKDAGGFLKVGVKKDGEKLLLGGNEVVKYSPTPSLLPATTEQIMSLAGKDFKQNYRDEGLQTMNFSKGMTLFSCARDGCITTLPLKVMSPWVEWIHVDRAGGGSGKTLIAVENDHFLWGGRKLLPQ